MNLYERALDQFGQFFERKVSSASNQGQKRTLEEFNSFFKWNPFGVNVETATAADIEAFVVGNWLPRHSASCCTVLPSTGKIVASATAVKGVVKDVSKIYTLLGYGGSKNPAKTKAVKSFRDGCAKFLHDEGVGVQTTKVFSEQKLDALLAFLTERLAATPKCVERCTLLMNQAAVLYVWESLAPSRGKECGNLSWRQVELEERAASPRPSKTVRQEPNARIPLANPETSLSDLCGGSRPVCEGVRVGGQEQIGRGVSFPITKPAAHRPLTWPHFERLPAKADSEAPEGSRVV